ncbi:hypothetical protein GCM10009039_23190 [Halocalculus aciditolerans]|uniref:Uncharacterized protein n=1 Tax=Halocalculus aciditolerans TaxID=1383812 RepID=A0A830F5D9_9EURY|nr:hypothetical protein GCM10009039_23190 [Halocalculus aciditolerans]
MGDRALAGEFHRHDVEELEGALQGDVGEEFGEGVDADEEFAVLAVEAVVEEGGERDTDLREVGGVLDGADVDGRAGADARPVVGARARRGGSGDFADGDGEDALRLVFVLRSPPDEVLVDAAVPGDDDDVLVTGFGRGQEGVAGRLVVVEEEDVGSGARNGDIVARIIVVLFDSQRETLSCDVLLTYRI